MYRNRKFNKNGRTKSTDSNENKRGLNTIDENTTIKIPRLNDETNKFKDVAEIEEMLSSEENIPASQEPTQRYLSQRSTIAATLGRTQSRINSSQRPPNTYFELALMKAGVQLDEGQNFVLSCDHVSFVNKLRILLDKNQNFQDNLKTFITGLRDAWSKYAIKLLSGCTISIPGDESVYQSQDSMIVNFFMIDFLRDKVLELLLVQIKNAACNKVSSSKTTGNNIPLLPLMLSQLQYVANTHGDIIYENIKTNFENALEQSKWDIIASAELILDSSKHDDFAKLLLDNMANSKELFKNLTIQTLTNLSLSSQMQGKLRSKVLAYIKEDQCPKATLPLLIKFLLKILSEENEESMKELVNTLREILHWREDTSTSSLAKDKQLQLELFGYIEQGLTRSKKFYSIWQKSIATLSSTQFKPIDFVIVLLLINIRDDNSLYLENVLRRHIKQLSTSIVQEIRNKYSPMLEQHWHILMQIINLYLRDKHKTVVDFARSCCGTFFEISESVQKSILKKLLELTCEKSNQNTTNFALQMLRDLWQLYPKILHNWGMLLLPFLDHIHEMSLSQTRIVMELLSSIAYPAPTIDECITLQDQIDMLVKKQIINRNIFVKKQGIIGAVQLIDCIARIEQYQIEADDFDTTYSTISDIPDGRGKTAAKYIERIQSSTVHSPDLLALFYDELAIVCSAGGSDRVNGLQLDIPFVIWLCELITFYFQSNFVAEHVPDKIDGIPLSYMKCINSLSDTNTEEQQSELPQIAINIGELVLRPQNEASSSILILSPLFNFVRALHMLRFEGSLESINALLGCAIILPKFFDDDNVDAIFFDYNEEMQKKILDIYFHCVNWIRETISSFATQVEPILRQKVLQRLVDLISIEDKIRQLLLKAPSDYTPPQCEFITGQNSSTTNSVKTGIKSRAVANAAVSNKNSNKTKALQNDTEILHLNETNLNDTTRAGDLTTKLAGANKVKYCTKNNYENIYGPKEIYRQMDTNIVLILKEKLDIKHPLPSEYIGYRMGLLEFRFILTDIVSKLESVVGIQKFQTEQSLQYIAKPGHFMCDLSNFIGAIGENMKVISTAINTKLEEVQRIYSHSDLFTEEFNLLKVCFGLCLRLLVAFYSWSEWFISEHRINKLRESLLILMERSQYQRFKDKPAPVLAVEVFEILIKYETSIVDLKSAVYLYQLMVILNLLSDKNSKTKQSQEIRSLCRILLCRKWFNYDGLLEKGAQCNIYLDELIKGFLRDSDFKRQREILRIVREESKALSGKDSSLKSFPNFKKANFPLFFRGLCEILITSLNQKLTTSSQETIDKLEFWESSCKILNMLLEVVQGLDIPRNFQIFLKHSHLYLKLVLQHGLNVFEHYLRQNPERVCELIKTMQTTTRFLHHLCCHSKAIKNTAIVSQIPFLRETVENYVFRIKALLTANKCASVFSMGNLKNKDLHGDDLVSQSGTFSTATGQDSDEEIPDDDVSVDETVMSHDDTENTRNETENRSKSSSRSKCF
ncbi:Fanconi anemia group D2 protein [Lucilia sericata]|uniref:Fanconi anemia group D2 protein n=1 Tax=Lucilia sericata TaxID=13632 RepID=UPI0018A844EE|nr:Fanconi anemia group D2 protein [Lucilia sericata]